MAQRKGECILEGMLLKKNQWFMKQERTFKLFPTGEIKYYKTDGAKEQCGTFNLTVSAKARKISRYEVELSLPEINRVVVLL